MVHALLLLQALISSSDSATIAAVRAQAEREPVEAIGDRPGLVRVRDVRLLDVNGDGHPEAFVSIEPKFWQTPTILIYSFDAKRPHRLVEALVPGTLVPLSDRFEDPHAYRVAIDLSPAGGGRGNPQAMVETAISEQLSVVDYDDFLHTDLRKGVPQLRRSHGATDTARVAGHLSGIRVRARGVSRDGHARRRSGREVRRRADGEQHHRLPDHAHSGERIARQEGRRLAAPRRYRESRHGLDRHRGRANAGRHPGAARSSLMRRALGIAVIIAALMALTFWRARWPGFLNPGVAECRVAYARARTAVESASVDAAHPASGPQKQAPSVSCGTLRVTGALR